jgi:uncharacterized protein (DUF1697 family)
MDQPGTRILLLRGVNVAGANRLPMAEFRAMLAGLGLGSVATHIQSGNAVFHDPGLPDLAARIAQGIAENFGFRPGVFLYDLPGYRAILRDNPYRLQGAAEGKLVHILFLAAPAVGADLAGLAALARDGEAVTLTDCALYLHAPNGIGQSLLAEKIPRFIKPLQTMRNQRSTEAILALAEGVVP